MPPTTRPSDPFDDPGLVLSHFTLGRHHDIDRRLDAAAAAGCSGIGLWFGQHELMEADGTADALEAMLESRGLCVAEIDTLRLPADGRTPPSADEVAAEHAAFRLADRHGCRSLHVIGPAVGGVAEVADSFGALCDRAKDHGLMVGLEFMPTTAVESAADALAVVEAADRDNGGICIDAWHHFRGADDIDMIRALPGERIVDVQVSDGPAKPTVADYGEDTRSNRLPPGDGGFDLAGFVAAIRSTGTSAPWAIEVCTDTDWEGSDAPDATAFVQRCAHGLRQLLVAEEG
ncbi:MAG: sugar phosphate isomerase/epimerase [Actinomycetia bacterium]|nr:sugar phosphate isomerase/epimerase [Actinomycetes bacterium]